jgi:uncharacterized protein (TIGR02646 family)
MRYIKRFSKPAILEKKEKEWTDKFLMSGKDRPDNSKYAHEDIRGLLESMSHHKCFYCEQKLKGIPSEIDHFIEVAEQKDLAFDWDNLYLACTNCNNKVPNKDIAVTDALNPCNDTDDIIEQHLSFEKEQIIVANNSIIGHNTIQKYKLAEPELDLLRSKILNDFKDVLIDITQTQLQEGRKELTQNEKNILQFFKQPTQPFSLMFRLLLAKYGL